MFIRLDGLNTDPALVASSYDFDSGGTILSRTWRGWFYARNRLYEPVLGRFTSKDPHVTGLPVNDSFAFHGMASSVSVDGFDGPMHYGDGLSLYGFVGGIPITGRDAMGLYDDSDYDDAIGDRLGHALYSLATLNERARWASLGLQTSLNIAASLLPGSGPYEAFKSVQVIQGGGGEFWDAVNIATAALPGIVAAKKAIGAVGDFGNAFRGLASARGYRIAGGISCFFNPLRSSFVGGTMVATPFGDVPIEHLRPGDWVISRCDVGAGEQVVLRNVTETIVDTSFEVIWVVLSDGSAIGATPNHYVWVIDLGWVPVGELCVGRQLLDRSNTPRTIVDLILECQPTAVFNLEVAGTFTYFADGHWVHNRSCPAGWHRHHLFPQEFREKFGRISGLHIDDKQWLLPLRDDWHSWLHSSKGFDWNGHSAAFFARHPNPTFVQTVQFMKQLKGRAAAKFETVFTE